MKTSKVIFAALAGSMLMMSGCSATAGNQKLGSMEKTQIDSTIVKGKSTKKDVEALLGETAQVAPTKDGGETWSYSFSRATNKPINFVPFANLVYSGFDTKTKVVVVEFDKDGVVKEYIAKESTGETKRGLFQ